MIDEAWTASGPPPQGDFVNMIVGYALTRKMRLPAVADAIAEAQYEARKHQRSHLVGTDIRSALLDYQIPSSEALRSAFEPPVRRQRFIPPPDCLANGLQPYCKASAAGLQRVP